MKNNVPNHGAQRVSAREGSSRSSRPVMVPSRLFDNHLKSIIQDNSRSKKLNEVKSDELPVSGAKIQEEKLSSFQHTSHLLSKTIKGEKEDLFFAGEGLVVERLQFEESIEVKVTTSQEENSKTPPASPQYEETIHVKLTRSQEEILKTPPESPQREESFQSNVNTTFKEEDLMTSPISSASIESLSRQNSVQTDEDDSKSSPLVIVKSEDNQSWNDTKVPSSKSDSKKSHHKSRPTSRLGDFVTPKRRSLSPKERSKSRHHKDRHGSSSSRRDGSVIPKSEKATPVGRKRQSSPSFERSLSSVRVRKTSHTDVKSEKKSSFEVNVYDSLKGSPSNAHKVGNEDVLHQSGSKIKPFKRDGHENCTPRRTTPMQSLNPSRKMSSSETYIDITGSSSSDDEIIDHKIFTVSDRDVFGSFSSSHTESVSSKSSYGQSCPEVDSSAPRDLILRPDTVYKLPSTPSTPCYSHGSYIHPTLIPVSASFFANTPPPPAPAMFQGVFQWPMYSNYLTPSPNQGNPGLFSPSPSQDKKYQCLQNFDEPPKPNFRGYQLIGDSMLLRFSQQIMGETQICAETIRFRGFCVSGQKIGELLKRLQNGFYHVGKKVVLMIGTNDLLRHTSLNQMCEELELVVKHLRAATEEVVLLTLPPVPLLESSTDHWYRLHGYNAHIRKMAERDSGLCVSDISPLYVVTQEELEEEALVAEFKAKTLFCYGCMTCMDENEDYCLNYSSRSDEDDIEENDLLPNAFSVTSPSIYALDIYSKFADRRIPKCRLDCYEMHYADSVRKDLIHLNYRGLTVVKDELLRKIS